MSWVAPESGHRYPSHALSVVEALLDTPIIRRVVPITVYALKLSLLVLLFDWLLVVGLELLLELAVVGAGVLLVLLGLLLPPPPPPLLPPPRPRPPLRPPPRPPPRPP